MSHGDGPPPIFEGDDFPYWKIRMEAYLEALDVGILRAASQGFPKPWDPTHLQGDEVNYEKWNAKATNTIIRGLCKDVLTVCGTTRTSMHCGRTFVRSMREQRVSVRNAIILS